jgi:hypothetical protein
MTDDDIAEGWYTDAGGAIRWWDGAQWTEHVRGSVDELERTVVLPADRPADHSATSARRTESRAEPEPDHKRRTWLTATVVGLLAFFLGMAVGGNGNTPDPAVIDEATASSGATVEELDRREADLESREGDLRTKQEEVDQREQDLEARERDLEASPAIGTGSIDNGVFEVGADVQPGTYETEGPDDPDLPCRYRVSTDEDGLDIISSEVSDGPGTVTLETGQYFTSEYCLPWTQTAPE